MKKSEEIQIRVKLFELIQEKGFTEYYVLMDYLMLNGTDDEYDIAMKEVVFFDTVLKSNRRLLSQ